MSKMIEVESCGECPIKEDGIFDSSYAICTFLKMGASTYVTIEDTSKILPNCPLEDYPEDVEDKLNKIKDWCGAYPLGVFPEPDFKKAGQVLKDNGISLDTITGSNMRHLLKGIQNIIEGE